jgi:SAM-dependent methyltransferase
MNVGSRLPLPASEKDYLRGVTGVFANPQDAEQYLYDSWERVQQALAWAEELQRAGARDALELGANPYFLTLLARRHLDLKLTLANFFGERVARAPGHHVLQTPEGAVELAYDHFDVESDAFPYADGSFDIVFFCEILEHLLSEPRISEMRRVLRPGGHVLITTPNATRLGNLVHLAKGLNIYNGYSPAGPHGRHNREYTLAEVVALVERHGLQPARTLVRNIYPHPLRSRLIQSLRPEVWREHLFVLARRD